MKKIIVEQDAGFISARAPALLYTDGLANCIGIALYESKTRTGHLIHSPMIEKEIPTLEEYLHMLFQQSNSNNLRVCVSGGSYDDSTREETQASREYTEKMLSTYLPSKGYYILWSPNDHVTSMTLNTITGKCHIRTEPFIISSNSSQDLE